MIEPGSEGRADEARRLREKLEAASEELAQLRSRLEQMRSDRLESLARAEQERERFRLAAEATRGMVYDLNLTRRTMWRSGGLTELLGWRAEEAPSTWEWWIDQIHPDDRRQYEEGVAAAARSGCRTMQQEYRALRRGGGWTWVWDQARIEYEGGRAARVVGCSMRIDDRKGAEERLKLQTQEFETLLDSAPMLVWIAHDPQCQTITGNRAANALLGVGAGRNISQTPPGAQERLQVRHFSPDGRELAPGELPLQRAAATGQAVKDVELEIRTGVGRRICLLGGAEPLLDEQGRVRGVVSAFRDVTLKRELMEELKAAGRELERANSAKDRFLAVLSHELRTPLTPILLTAQMLESDLTLSAEMREWVEMIRRNVETETRLIDDLLDVTRISRSKLQLHPEPTCVHQVIEETVRLCAQEIEHKPLRVAMELQARPDVMRADPARLRQVFWNLLKNAVKFTPPGGLITLGTRTPERGGLEAWIRDTGIGIEPGRLERVFETFEQGGAEVTRRFGGLGLGLSIARSLVDMHGGRIRAESAGLNLGSRFVVEFGPEAMEVELPPRRPAPRQVGDRPPEARRARILLVEDHEDTARMMARLLRNGGHQVWTAGSVAAARLIVERQEFDLMISDIGLPDGSGLDLMEELVRRHGMRGIALSGYGMEQDIFRSHAAGFMEHLTKPVKLDELRRAVSRMLSAEA